MKRARRLTKALLRSIARGEDRSPLFWWMVEDHDLIVASAGKRIYWKGLCAQAAKLGLNDANGNPPSPRTARETWRKARVAVAEARAAEAAQPPPRPGSVFPSRIPKDWRPQVVPVPAAAASGTAVALRPASTPVQVPTVAGPPPDQPTSLGSPDDPPEVRAMWARLEQQFDKVDRWLGGPSKRRPD
jgi:hypothetical protein